MLTPATLNQVANSPAAPLFQAKSILENWLSQHPDCFPPIVINITDGDPTNAADEIRKLKNSDGEVLLFAV
jgi:hypothetical protein